MRLVIPYQAVSDLPAKELIISQPARCFHCNAEPAPQYETHMVVIKADKIPHRQLGKKYRIQNKILVRLPLCDTCYRKEYLVAPDAYAKDNTSLGAQSRSREKLANIAGILAGLGILLLTPFIPAVGFLNAIKSHWYILLGSGVVILAITWGLQRNSQTKVFRELDDQHADLQQYPRADIWVDPINERPDPASTVMEISMENENWLKDCSRLNGWRIQE